MSPTLQFIVVAIVISMNAVLAAYETAISSVTLARLLALEKMKIHGAAAAVAMKSRIERTLAVVQLGTTLVGVIAGAFSGATVESTFAPMLERKFGISSAAAHSLALLAVVLPLTGFTVVFAELAPKVLAIRHKERVACVLSPGMRWLTGVLAPVATLLESLVRLLLDLVARIRGHAPARPR